MKIPWSVGAGARAERLCVRLRVHVRLAVSRRTCSAGVCALNRERALIGGGAGLCVCERVAAPELCARCALGARC